MLMMAFQDRIIDDVATKVGL